MIELRDLWLVLVGPIILVLIYPIILVLIYIYNNKSGNNNKPETNKSTDKSNNNNRSKSRNNSGGDGRKRRDKIIKEIQASMIKHIGIIDGLTLLIGALNEKIKKFETIVVHILTEVSSIKSTDHNSDSFLKLIESMKKDNNTKFVNIHNNFYIVKDSFKKFEKELNILRNAIFIPDISDDDSELSDNNEVPDWTKNDQVNITLDPLQ